MFSLLFVTISCGNGKVFDTVSLGFYMLVWLALLQEVVVGFKISVHVLDGKPV